MFLFRFHISFFGIPKVQLQPTRGMLNIDEEDSPMGYACHGIGCENYGISWICFNYYQGK